MCGWKTYNIESFCSCRGLFCNWSKCFPFWHSLQRIDSNPWIARQGGRSYESKCYIVQRSFVASLSSGVHGCASLHCLQWEFLRASLLCSGIFTLPGWVCVFGGSCFLSKSRPVHIHWPVMGLGGTHRHHSTGVWILFGFPVLLLLCFLLSAKSTDNISPFWIVKLISRSWSVTKVHRRSVFASRVKNISWRQRKSTLTVAGISIKDIRGPSLHNWYARILLTIRFSFLVPNRVLGRWTRVWSTTGHLWHVP